METLKCNNFYPSSSATQPPFTSVVLGSVALRPRLSAGLPFSDELTKCSRKSHGCQGAVADGPLISYNLSRNKAWMRTEMGKGNLDEDSAQGLHPPSNP